MQRLCRASKAIVEGSPTLQAKLFRKSAQSEKSSWWVLDTDANILVGEEAKQYLEATSDKGETTKSVKPRVYNRLLLSQKHLAGNVVDRLATRQASNRPGEAFSLRGSQPWYQLAKDASCLSMFLTSPPVTKVRVFIYGRCEFAPGEDRRGLSKWFIGCTGDPEIENTEGVKYGELIDTIKGYTKYDGYVSSVHFPGEFVVSREVKRSVEGRASATEVVSEADALPILGNIHLSFLN